MIDRREDRLLSERKALKQRENPMNFPEHGNLIYNGSNSAPQEMESLQYENMNSKQEVSPYEISNSLEKLYQTVFNSARDLKKSKDPTQLSYEYEKEISKIQINKDEPFTVRMLFDVIKRQSKELQLKTLIERDKVKIDEAKRIKGFNRLIEDANRRVEAQMQLEVLKEKLIEDIAKKPPKKYKESQWEEIYNSRFKLYQEEKEEKRRKLIEDKKKREEEEEEKQIQLCKVKKAPLNLVKQLGQRLYEQSFNKNKINKQFKKEENSITKIKNNNTINCVREAKKDAFTTFIRNKERRKTKNDPKSVNKFYINDFNTHKVFISTTDLKEQIISQFFKHK